MCTYITWSEPDSMPLNQPRPTLRPEKLISLCARARVTGGLNPRRFASAVSGLTNGPPRQRWKSSSHLMILQGGLHGSPLIRPRTPYSRKTPKPVQRSDWMLMSSVSVEHPGTSLTGPRQYIKFSSQHPTWFSHYGPSGLCLQPSQTVRRCVVRSLWTQRRVDLPAVI